MLDVLTIPGLRRVGAAALGAVLPARCLGCGDIVDRPGSLCAMCWTDIDFLAPPLCACCGMPFEVDSGPGSLCGACMGRRPHFERARSVFRYTDRSPPHSGLQARRPNSWGWCLWRVDGARGCRAPRGRKPDRARAASLDAPISAPLQSGGILAYFRLTTSNEIAETRANCLFPNRLG